MGIFDAVLDFASQPRDLDSGGTSTPPELRLLIYALVKLLRVDDVVETGYDAGYTTRVLGETGAKNVVGIDNLSEYGGVDTKAKEMLGQYSNISLLNDDALKYLRSLGDESVGFVFIDDLHSHDHVRREVIELRRVLVKGGVAVFHDVYLGGIMKAIEEELVGWNMLFLPCHAPYTDLNFGVGVARKPGKIWKPYGT